MRQKFKKIGLQKFIDNYGKRKVEAREVDQEVGSEIVQLEEVVESDDE